MNILKFLGGKWWGANAETQIILYKSLVRSIIDYGSFVYFPTQHNQIYKLERIQYAAIRLALGYRKSTPTNILLAESKLSTIKERTKFLCMNYLYKILTNENLLIHKTINSYVKTFQNKSYNKNKRLIILFITQV